MPDKNLRVLAGQPLVAHAVAPGRRPARASTGCIVSTDSPAIAEVAAEAGAEVPWLRPPELSDDTAREWDAWQHLLAWLEDRDETPDRLLVVPCTAPLRTVDDLERCVDAAPASPASTS